MVAARQTRYRTSRIYLNGYSKRPPSPALSLSWYVSVDICPLNINVRALPLHVFYPNMLVVANWSVQQVLYLLWLSVSFEG